MKSAVVVVLLVALTAVNVGAALVNFASKARADVAGMDYMELKRDRDFRRAVQSIVEGCSLNGSMLSC
ncbi:hypothetical protein RX330_20390 [Bradyrhizobium sp. NDS-1]|uniref:hypothetical protein n=1 Tax=Bradyrhizobium sp. NDS-1 TaxID=3080014 RepID=UPI00293E06C0|nr:hypothetical protein [Bradyrhizobium sp. NDS-1]WOH70659.1 hypothetical protein RX330_20390 [Bradyrhizobium sp. NDS-1]